jgi:ketosteroid isomerase-like protein
MSQENAEIVRRIYEEGWFDRDPEPLLALVSPDVEFVNPPDAVDSGVRYGPDGVRSAFRNVKEAFDTSRHELRDLFGAEDVVVAAVSSFVRSGGSDIEVVQEEAHTWTFHDAKIVRIEWGRDLEAALEAAELSDQDAHADPS